MAAILADCERKEMGWCLDGVLPQKSFDEGDTRTDIEKKKSLLSAVKSKRRQQTDLQRFIRSSNLVLFTCASSLTYHIFTQRSWTRISSHSLSFQNSCITSTATPNSESAANTSTQTQKWPAKKNAKRNPRPRDPTNRNSSDDP
jgi:hypothetical protein